VTDEQEEVRDKFAFIVAPWMMQRVAERIGAQHAAKAAERLMASIEEAMSGSDPNAMATVFSQVAEERQRAENLLEHMREQAYPEIARETYRLANAFMSARARGTSLE
jgi:hypothetical protein